MTGISWSINVFDADTGAVLLAEDPDLVLRTASVGKVLLLVTAAAQIAAGRLDPDEQCRRSETPAVADSGVWQYLSVPSLSVHDLCQLIGMASDNLATNVLLQRVGLDTVAATGNRLGLVDTGLHDSVRDLRGPEHPSTLSTGTAHELSTLMAGLEEPVLGWLAKGLDLSQVASSWGLDPLSHHEIDLDLRVVNKTGTDVGVRADVGVLTGSGRRVAYAVIANWDGSADGRRSVLDRQRAIGARIAEAARGNW